MNVTFNKVQSDWLEASFYEMVQLPDVEVPAKPALFDADGNEVQAAEPARTEPGALQRVEVAFVSYHPTQLDLLRADAATHGADLALHESLLEKWVEAYVPPAPEPTPVPQVLTMRQARLVLHQVGLLDDVEAAVKAADRSVQIEWEYAQEVHRNWPTLVALAGALKLDDAALDALFMSGAQL